MDKLDSLDSSWKFNDLRVARSRNELPKSIPNIQTHALRVVKTGVFVFCQRMI